MTSRTLISFHQTSVTYLIQMSNLFPIQMSNLFLIQMSNLFLTLTQLTISQTLMMFYLIHQEAGARARVEEIGIEADQDLEAGRDLEVVIVADVTETEAEIETMTDREAVMTDTIGEGFLKETVTAAVEGVEAEVYQVEVPVIVHMTGRRRGEVRKHTRRKNIEEKVLHLVAARSHDVLVLLRLHLPLLIDILRNDFIIQIHS